MPICKEREYRTMAVTLPNEEEYVVEGYATTFNDPYVLFSDGDKDYFELPPNILQIIFIIRVNF